MQGQAGKIKIGCFLFIVLFCVSVLLIFLFAPTYVEKIALEEELTELINRAGVRGWDDNAIKNEVIDICRTRGFEVTRQDISVNRDPRSRPVRKIRIEVAFSKEVGLYSYTHVLRFRYQGEGLIGRL